MSSYIDRLNTVRTELKVIQKELHEDEGTKKLLQITIDSMNDLLNHIHEEIFIAEMEIKEGKP